MKNYLLLLTAGLFSLTLGLPQGKLTQSCVVQLASGECYVSEIVSSELVDDDSQIYALESHRTDDVLPQLCFVPKGSYLPQSALLTEEGAGQTTFFADLISDTGVAGQCSGYLSPEYSVSDHLLFGFSGARLLEA